MNTKPFAYSEVIPGPPLAEHILAFWCFDVHLPRGSVFTHHVWPDGCVSVAVASSGGGLLSATVVGPRLGPYRVAVSPGASYRGVRFWPDAGGRVLGVPAERLRERALPLAEILPAADLDGAAAVAAAADAGAAAVALAEWLGPRAPRAPLDPLVRLAVRRIVAARGEEPIGALAAALGHGPRQLQRRFRAAVGLTAKEYARVRRARAAIAGLLAGEGRWTRLAAALGYADQSHLAREFGDLTGFTPTALRERLGLIEHRDVTP